jgi:hypothetical protein
MNYLFMVLPIMLIQLGNFLKKKDTDAIGRDDAVGNILIALAPAIDAFSSGNESAVKKALRAARIAIDNYLGEETPKALPRKTKSKE